MTAKGVLLVDGMDGSQGGRCDCKGETISDCIAKFWFGKCTSEFYVTYGTHNLTGTVSIFIVLYINNINRIPVKSNLIMGNIGSSSQCDQY